MTYRVTLGYPYDMKRTTVRLSDGLMERARAEAQRRGTTLTALIEEGLTVVLAGVEPKTEIVDLPICRAGGGTFPGIDINNSAQLREALEQE